MQPSDPSDAERQIGGSAKWPLSSHRIQRRAAVLAQELEGLHWDNCKVIYQRGLTFAFALGALRDGHDAKVIVKCYDRALHECHAFATDRTAHLGHVCRFELSSTVSRARKHLNRDGLTPAQRVRRWREQKLNVANGAGSREKSGPVTCEAGGPRLSQSCS